jgi:hypothetical protein
MSAQEGFLGDLLRLSGIAEHPAAPRRTHGADTSGRALRNARSFAGPEPIEKARGLGIIVSLHGKTICAGGPKFPQR